MNECSKLKIGFLSGVYPGKTFMCVYVCVARVGRAHGADDFLPVMMYVLARSNLSALQMDVEYMMELMDPSLTLGEGTPMHITYFYHFIY